MLPYSSALPLSKGHSRIASRQIKCNWHVRKYGTHLPVQTDLLERYRGLLALGHIKHDEEQIRVIMQLRKLHRELEGYAPPALMSRYFNQTHAVSSTQSSPPAGPWWQADDPIIEHETAFGSLVRVRTHAEEIEALTTPKGLLVTGPPGSGKSFLIDLWFATLPTPYKARKHYNELVLEIYRAVWEETRRRMAATHSGVAAEPPVEVTGRIWNKAIREQWRELLNSGSLPIRWKRMSNLSFSLSRGPLEPSVAYVVAQRLILRHWLLVFDEIQLLDVSSATLLADVLSWYWRMGGIIVGSSNKVPDDLYRNGVQRERLEPFVEALKARCPVVLMRSDRDWRAVRANEGQRSWFTFAQRREFEIALAEIRRDLQGEASTANVVVFGRTIRVQRAGNGTCEFTFSELCEESLGPADYITLASRYHTFIITSIPILKQSTKNEARRFISLIDALYEARCRIVCLAEALPEDLFFPDVPTQSGESDHRVQQDVDVMMAEAVGETQDVYRPNVSSYDAPNMSQERIPAKALALDTLSIFSGKDEQFAFKRALSRLLEMTSESYARDERWNPLPAHARKWETAESASPPHAPPRSLRTTPSSSPDFARSCPAPSPLFNAHDSDFAEEASPHASLSHNFPADRPPAPRLSADHIWGVREDWGDRAREWGRGAAVYSPDPALAGSHSASSESSSGPASETRPASPDPGRSSKSPSEVPTPESEFRSESDHHATRRRSA